MSRSTRNPTNWDDYQYGTSFSRSSISSGGGRSVRFESEDGRPLSPSDAGEGGHDGDTLHPDLRRRRSSMTMRLNALGEIGGVNSINNFARSWTRAAGFHEVTPQRPAFLLSGEEPGPYTEEQLFSRSDIEHRGEGASLIRAHLERSRSGDEEAIEDDNDITPRPLGPEEAHKHRLGSDIGSMIGSVRGRQSIFEIAPHLATPLAGSYGTSYGTLYSTLDESSMRQAGRLWRQQEEARAAIPDRERPLLLIKEVEQDGEVVFLIQGQSTLPQTVFNSTNVLIGVGLLSLPLGMRYSGWILGTIFLSLAAAVTAYTAKLLAKCMDVDNSLITFADLAFISYGQKARVATSILFSLELLAACVALVVLFADTLNLLIPSVGVNQWKILCGILLVPLNFAPLRLLSFSSILGILSCFSIVLIVFVDGFVKAEAPGSLREPAKTYLFPDNWWTLPLSFGLLMSPWGGHSVFPNIYRDMRHPYKYDKAVKLTFSFTYLLDAATAMAGYLMFGDGVLDELTANLLNEPGYPRFLSILLTIFIAIIPLTKLPLNARPIISTIETFAGLHVLAVSEPGASIGLSPFTRRILKFAIRIVVIIVFVITAILFPSFDSIMAFMGSALCFTICVILPLLFHLKIFGDRINPGERRWNWFLIVVSSIMAAVGTVFSFLPKSVIERM